MSHSNTRLRRGLIAPAVLLAAAIGAASPAVTATAVAQQPPDRAEVVTWSQFLRLLDNRSVMRPTGVSDGYVAFMVCDGYWLRVRASVSDVVLELERRNYRARC